MWYKSLLCRISSSRLRSNVWWQHRFVGLRHRHANCGGGGRQRRGGEDAGEQAAEVGGARLPWEPYLNDIRTEGGRIGDDRLREQDSDKGEGPQKFGTFKRTSFKSDFLVLVANVGPQEFVQTLSYVQSLSYICPAFV